MVRRAKALNLLVGPMRPLAAGGAYDPGFHTFEVLSVAGLGVSYDEGRPVLVPMVYEGVASPTPAPDCGCVWCHDGHPEQCCNPPGEPEGVT